MITNSKLQKQTISNTDSLKKTHIVEKEESKSHQNLRTCVLVPLIHHGCNTELLLTFSDSVSTTRDPQALPLSLSLLRDKSALNQPGKPTNQPNSGQIFSPLNPRSIVGMQALRQPSKPRSQSLLSTHKALFVSAIVTAVVCPVKANNGIPWLCNCIHGSAFPNVRGIQTPLPKRTKPWICVTCGAGPMG